METLNDVFQMVSDRCKEDISDIAHKLWIQCIDPLKLENSTAYLHVKSEFQKGIIEQKYMKLLQQSFAEVLGFDVQIQISYDSAEKSNETIDHMINAEESKNGEAEEYPMTLNLPKNLSMDGGEYEYTFQTFIVGSSNKFAHAASLAVAANPANAYNPLFIYGNSGLGKTHLLYAICAEIKKNRPNTNIVYAKGEEFTNELIDAIQAKNTKDFHEKYRKSDVLLIDDIQFIGGKESTQEEFFHTFNTIYQAGKQIVLTSDRPPKEIKTLEDRLRSRFEWGLLADIQPPDFETRIAIIRRKAQLLGLDIPDDVSEYIANRLKTNIRQLEGAVKKLKAYELIGNMPSIMVAQNAIKDILNDNQPVPVTVERIISEASRTFGVSALDIRSPKRSAPVSTARQVAMYIVREITQMSMSAIGEEFGGRDHTTVVYAMQQVEKNRGVDTKYKETIDDIIKNIRGN
ncbi:MAG: chromosomal replication initiator protein DnaA [Oscillospiraceae bacterium]